MSVTISENKQQQQQQQQQYIIIYIHVYIFLKFIIATDLSMYERYRVTLYTT